MAREEELEGQDVDVDEMNDDDDGEEDEQQPEMMNGDDTELPPELDMDNYDDEEGVDLLEALDNDDDEDDDDMDEDGDDDMAGALEVNFNSFPSFLSPYFL